MQKPTKNKAEKIDTIIVLLVTTAVVTFLAFFILKINGQNDFTHKYGIQDITATMDQESVMMMLDGDPETEWKNAPIWTEPVAEPGDNIVITFEKSRPISHVKLTGQNPDNLIFYANRSEDLVEVTPKEDGVYQFDTAVTTDLLRIEVGEKLKNKDYRWRISELEIR